LWNNLSSTAAAVPVSVISNPLPAQTETMAELLAKGILTRPLEPGPAFLWGGLSEKPPKNPNAPPGDFKTEFRKNQEITVQMNWQKRDKNGKGFLSAEMFVSDHRKTLFFERPADRNRRGTEGNGSIQRLWRPQIAHWHTVVL
jgi:hypothetical protein